MKAKPKPKYRKVLEGWIKPTEDIREIGPRMVEFTLFTKPAMCNATKKQEIRVRVTIEEI